MPTSVKNLQYLKATNQASILRHLATMGPTSRVELAHKLGLSKMAITNLVADMIQDDLVFETDQKISHNGMTGRKSIALDIPDCRINAVGLFIERFAIHCNAMDIKGRQFYYDKLPIPPESDNAAAMEIIFRLLDRLFQKYSEDTFSGIGISSIGPVDLNSVTILHPTNFYHISNLPVGKFLREKTRLPIFMLNCMSAAALAERLYGNAKNCNHVVYLGLGSGVGAGAVINGNIFTGSKGFASELGHMSIDPIRGRKCFCGQRGCLETYTSTYSILKRLRYPSMEQLLKDIEANCFTDKAREELSTFYQAVRSAIIAIANIYDPEMIVVGDQGSQLLEPYLPKLQKELHILMIQHDLHDITLTTSAFQNQTSLIGAPSIIFDRIFSKVLPPFNGIKAS